LARRATYLDEIWNEGNPILMVDAGDVLGGGRRDKMDKEQSRFLCEVFGSFGFDAIGLGEMDLTYGLGFLREMIESYKLPFTNANCRLKKTGDLILPPYLVVEKAGIRFGIISVLDPERKIMTVTSKDDEFLVEDPVAALRTLIPEIRKEAQTIVLLGHVGDQKIESLLQEVEGVDIAVTGHAFRTLQTERAVGQTVLLTAVFEGRQLGRADCEIGQDGSVKAFSVAITDMDDSVTSDPVMLQKVEQFKEHLEELRLALRGAHQQVKGSDEEEFLGERTCIKCHQDVWEIVKESGHQNAMTTLRDKGQTFNPDCLVCHVVGYVYKGGYDDRPPFNRLGNVQCEACHGYGTMHMRDGKWKAQARSSCVECHDKENSPEFDFATYWERIKH
jgi:2',3'-cyclic-nucleotide 2'-phosphodiesterase (5'-nucleotidase family)